MYYSRIVLLALLIAASSRGFAAQKGGAIVHEWGTFTSVQGSDGRAQEGLHHEEESLPAFVYGRDPRFEPRNPVPGATPTPTPTPTPTCRFKCFEIAPFSGGPLAVTQKMETPVLYFYTETPTKFKVDVGFPKGIVSQYYPMPISFEPPIGGIRGMFGGKVSFEVETQNTNLDLPTVSPSNPYLQARNVPSRDLKSGSDQERFIFYRGLGNFETALRVSSRAGELQLDNVLPQKIMNSFLVNITETGGDFIHLESIQGNGRIVVSAETVQNLVSSRAHDPEKLIQTVSGYLVKALISTGLYSTEAKAMVKTWERSYFRSPGLRVLYLLSREETDQILPIQIQPMPSQLVRTLVGRIEVLLDTQESQLIEGIRKQGTSFPLNTLGRFAEAKLRRILEVAPSDLAPTIRDLIEIASY